jgi:hypothetical protein
MKPIEDWPYAIGDNGVIVRINEKSITAVHVTEKFPPGAEPSSGYGSYVVLSDGDRKQSFDLKTLREKYHPSKYRTIGVFQVREDGSVLRGTRTWSAQDDGRTVIRYTENKRPRTVTLNTLRKQAWPEVFGSCPVQEIQTIQSLRARIAILEERLNEQA